MILSIRGYCNQAEPDVFFTVFFYTERERIDFDQRSLTIVENNQNTTKHVIALN